MLNWESCAMRQAHWPGSTPAKEGQHSPCTGRLRKSHGPMSTQKGQMNLPGHPADFPGPALGRRPIPLPKAFTHLGGLHPTVVQRQPPDPLSKPGPEIVGTPPFADRMNAVTTSPLRDALIEPCMANERRASNGSPAHKGPVHVGRSLAMQRPIGAKRPNSGRPVELQVLTLDACPHAPQPVAPPTR